MTRIQQSSRRRYREFLKSVATLMPPNPDEVRLGARAGRLHLQRYLSWLTAHWWAISAVFVLSVLGMAGDMVFPAFSAYIIDHIVLNSELDAAEKGRRLALTGIAMCAATCLEWTLSWIRAVRMQLLSSKFAVSLRRRLYHHVLRLPFDEIAKLKSGGLLSRLASDVEDVTNLLDNALIGPSIAILRLAVLLCILFALDYRMALLVAVATPIVMYWTVTRGGRLRPIWKSIGSDRQDVMGRANEALGGLTVVRAFRRERAEELAFTSLYHAVVRKEMLATHVFRSMTMAWGLFMPLTQIAILSFGGYLIARGQMTMGVLVAVQTLAWSVFEPIRLLSNTTGLVQRGLAASERVSEVFDQAQDKADSPDAVQAPSLVEEIRFDAVCFGYKADAPVIHGFDLRVPGGSVVALTGRSGAGKTTLASLLARFHDPVSGGIFLNGIDLKKIRLQSYRRLVGIVPQDTFLFAGSVRDNIAYGRPEAAADEIEHASIRAQADEFVQKLPNGYDTLIGERGYSLSGGQRQRLAIARAFLADPRILILDEATSNLDAESEGLIQSAMPSLLAGRTTLVIAHRLSTLAHADQIIVLDQGRIVESGTPNELIRGRGAYYHMISEERHRPRVGDRSGRVEGSSEDRDRERAQP